MFFEKPTKGPDTVGGIWPQSTRARVWNRSGAALDKGDVVQFATTPGEATEVASNDANSYIPGASNDTCWNTVIDPRLGSTRGANVKNGAIWAVVLDTGISDNKAGWVQTFGIVDAYVQRSNTTTTEPWAPLTVYASNNSARQNTFDPVILSSEVVVAHLLGVTNGALTTKRLRKVFLHQGAFYSSVGFSNGIS